MTQGQSQVKVLSIHEFAQICRTTPRTLRFYEQKGLIKPHKIDRFTHYRYYLPEQVRKFSEIKLLQNFEIHLNEMPLQLVEKNAENILNNKLKLLQAEIQEKKKTLIFLKNITKLFYKPDQMVLKPLTIGPYYLLCWKITQGDYSKISNYGEQMKIEAKKLGLEFKNSEIIFYLSPDYQPKHTPLEIALICKKSSKNITLPENYYFKNFSKTNVLSLYYKGPYEFMDLIYRKTDEIMLKNKIKNLPFDINLHGPLDKKSKYDYSTLICYPIN